jgi:hypothetical protein
MQKHVGILLLRPLRSIALGVGIGRDMKRVQPDDAIDVAADVSEKTGSTSSRMSCPSNSDHISPTVSSPTRVTTPPISLSTASTAACLAHQSARVRGSLRTTAQTSPASLAVAQRVYKPGVVMHVIDARPHIAKGPEHRMRGYVFDALAIDPDLAAVADRITMSSYDVGCTQKPVLVSRWVYSTTTRTSGRPSTALLQARRCGTAIRLWARRKEPACQCRRISTSCRSG